MCTSIQWELEVSAWQVVARMVIHALRAPEAAHGMRPQLGKERRKTVPNSGPVCLGMSGLIVPHLYSLVPSSLPTATKERSLLGEANGCP